MNERVKSRRRPTAMCVPGSGSSRVVERASGACDRNVADPTTTTHLTGEAEQWPSRSVGFLGCRFNGRVRKSTGGNEIGGC